MTAAFIIDSIGWTLLHFVWQGAVIGCMTALMLTAMRNASPVLRYRVACLGLMACVLWPAAELALRLQGEGMMTAQMRYADALVSGRAGGSAGLAAFLQAQMGWLVGLWAACAAALTLRMTLGLLWVERAARLQGRDPALQAAVTRLATVFGVAREVRLRLVDNLASPQTAGWWRPVILVPTSLATGMPPDLLEALLAHEMAHIKRLDYLVNLVQHVVEIVFFYHPAVWWISGCIRSEREQIADDLAARHTGSPRTLARALSELERFQFSGHHLAVGADGGDLLTRVRRLIKPAPTALGWSAAFPALGLAAACISIYAQAGVPLALAPVPDQHAMVRFDSCQKPMYPAADLAAQHTGTVTVAFEIDTVGKVAASRVTRSSGHAGLDGAAQRALEKCLFQPARRAGVPVKAWTRVQYVWTLG